MKYADLHVHTFYSDSTSSPEEVAACAADRGLSAVAICDHDSIEGIEPCRKAGDALGVEIIPGIELTAEKEDAEIHLLGYFMDCSLGWFRDKLKELQTGRIDRIHAMVKKLHAEGIEMTAEEVFALSGKGTVGRLHLALAILKTGKVKTIKDIFENYIGFKKCCYVANIRLTPREAMDMILRAGGVPVLAHPGCMRKDQYIEGLVSDGLLGIEVYHSDHRAGDIRRYEEFAKKYNLIATGGSDCHGLGKGRVMLGEVRVPYTVVEQLKQASDKVRDGQR